MSDITQDKFVLEEPQAVLEKRYIEEYLRSKGHTVQSLRELPEAEAKQFMIEASTYASTRLAEMEKRTQLLQALHGTAESVNLEPA